MGNAPHQLPAGFAFLAGLRDDSPMNALLDADRIDVTAIFGTEEDRRLIAFAKKRGIAVVGNNWRQTVFMAAAREHPEIARKPARRGRPKKITELSKSGPDPSSAEYNAWRLIRLVDKTNDAILRSGKSKLITDRSVMRRFLEMKGQASDLVHDRAREQNLANWVSRLRKQMGHQRRPRKK